MHSSLPIAIRFTICYYSLDMTAYTVPRTPTTISQDVAARRAARRKVIEKARQLERESYKAVMRKKRQLQARSELATIA